MKREVKRYADMGSMSRSAAASIAGLAAERVGRSGLFSLVLSGGGTPKLLYEYLAETPLRDSIPWRAVHIFWGDERCVPPDHADSNYLMAYQTLLSKVGLPPGNIHRVPVDEGPPEKVARMYDESIRKFLATSSSFDVMLLGVGADGHTASLFPRSPALEEKKRFVVAVEAPAPYTPACRVTLTFPAIGMTEVIMFLVAGAEKEKVVSSITAGQEAAGSLYPVARAIPKDSQIWYVVKGGQVLK